MPLLPLYVYVVIEDTQGGSAIVAVCVTKKLAEEARRARLRATDPEKAALFEKLPFLVKSRLRIEEHPVTR